MLAESGYNHEKYCSSKLSKALECQPGVIHCRENLQALENVTPKALGGLLGTNQGSALVEVTCRPGSLQLFQTSGAAGHWVVFVCGG